MGLYLLLKILKPFKNGSSLSKKFPWGENMKKSFKKSLVWVVTVTLSLNGTPFTSKAYAQQFSTTAADPNQKAIAEKQAPAPSGTVTPEDGSKAPVSVPGIPAYEEYPAEEMTLRTATNDERISEPSDKETTLLNPKPSGGNILYDAEGNPIAMTNKIDPVLTLQPSEEKAEDSANEPILKTLGQFEAADALEKTEEDLTVETAPEKIIDVNNVRNWEIISKEKAAYYIAEELRKELKTDVKVEVHAIDPLYEKMTSDMMAAGGVIGNRAFRALFSYSTAEGRGGKGAATLIFGFNGIRVILSGMGNPGEELPPVPMPPLPLPPKPIDPTTPPPGFDPPKIKEFRDAFEVIQDPNDASFYMQGELLLKRLSDGVNFFAHFSKDERQELKRGMHIFALLSNPKKMVEGNSDMWDAKIISKESGAGIKPSDNNGGQKFDDGGVVLNGDHNGDGVIDTKDTDYANPEDRNKDGVIDVKDSLLAKAEIGAFHVPADRMILVKGVIKRFKSDASAFLIAHGIDAIDGGGRKFGDEQKLEVDDNGIFYARLKADQPGIHRIHLLQRMQGGEDRVIAETKVEVAALRSTDAPAEEANKDGIVNTMDTDYTAQDTNKDGVVNTMDTDYTAQDTNKDGVVNTMDTDYTAQDTNKDEAVKTESSETRPKDSTTPDSAEIAAFKALAAPEGDVHSPAPENPVFSYEDAKSKAANGEGTIVDLDPKHPSESPCAEGVAIQSPGASGTTAWFCPNDASSNSGNGISATVADDNLFNTTSQPTEENSGRPLREPTEEELANTDAKESAHEDSTNTDHPVIKSTDPNKDGELDDKDRGNLPRVLEVRIPEPKSEATMNQESKEWAVVKLKMPEEPSSDEGLKPVDPQTFMIKAVSSPNQKPGAAIASAALQTPEVQRFFTAVMDIQPRFVPMISAESLKDLGQKLKGIGREAAAVLRSNAEGKIEAIKSEVRDKEIALKTDTTANNPDNGSRVSAVIPVFKREAEKQSPVIAAVRRDAEVQIKMIREENQNKIAEIKKLAEAAVAAVKNFKMNAPLAAAPVVTTQTPASFAPTLTGGSLLGGDDDKNLLS